MTGDNEVILSTILRRVLVATDDVAILADVRGLQRKVKGLGVDPHSVGMNGSTSATNRYDILKNQIKERDEARSISRVWSKAGEDVVKRLAESRGGHAPEGHTWRWTTETMDTDQDVADRWTKRLAWEINQIIRRNADLHAEKAKLEDRVIYLEAALAHVTGKDAP
ncbi:hypothetical protein [Brevundimonas sp. TWP1-2-1b1]|uniref:hypothetical protein n=1 Tax=unclassified Brevundimonas TaxID=2622653 RepID=UPI003CEFBCAF